MKSWLVGGLLGGLLCGLFASVVTAADAAKGAGLGKMRHVVLFKFKETATPEQIKTVEEAFRQLPKKIPQILDFEWGTNVSPEGKADGFTHCFFLTFPDAAARDAYLPHPAHKEFGKSLRGLIDKVLVVDYVAKD